MGNSGKIGDLIPLGNSGALGCRGIRSRKVTWDFLRDHTQGVCTWLVQLCPRTAVTYFVRHTAWKAEGVRCLGKVLGKFDGLRCLGKMLARFHGRLPGGLGGDWSLEKGAGRLGKVLGNFDGRRCLGKVFGRLQVTLLGWLGPMV